MLVYREERGMAHRKKTQTKTIKKEEKKKKKLG
jgi:hypothetical protein